MKKIISISLILGLFACQETKNTNNYSASANKLNESEIKVANLDDETSKQIVMAYLKINDALVDTDAERAALAAEELLFNFEENKMDLIGKLFHEVKLIAETKEIDQQRLYFEGLSNNVYTLAKNSENIGVTLYQQYCPMAFDNSGAYWISNNKKVYNPYFGDKMLRCGKVTEVIE